jgi:predicted metalloprotease
MVRWRKRRGEGLDQIEDRRGIPGGAATVGGGLGLGGLLLLLVLQFLGGNLGGGGGTAVNPDIFLEPLAPAGGQTGPAPSAGEDLVDFVGVVVDDVQATWADIFSRSGRTYEQTKLVLFEATTQSGCGFASEASGPFYCPLDKKVYLDLTFFRDLETRFGAPGDFAGAYVIAHEFGHHVQNITGIAEDVRARQQSDPGAANELSVRLELQADCLAGIWANSAFAQGDLDAGDIEEGLAAAAAVGDDRIQSQSGGVVNPESWTHGSSEQRTQWFRTGYESGDPSACDTFAA